MMSFNELLQVGSVKEKQDRSKDRALWHSEKNYAPVRCTVQVDADNRWVECCHR